MGLVGRVAVGAVGGSGTRIIADLLRRAGIFIGDDLNGPNDNLAFTFLFRRPSVLLETEIEFDALVKVFYTKMMGRPFTDAQCDLVERQAQQPIPRQNHQWMQERMHALFSSNGAARPAFGWKEPNTHVIIDRLLSKDTGLRYIHVVRNGLDMAFSENQNQLRVWGATFLDRTVDVCPRDSLSYWCAVDARLKRIVDHNEGRVLLVDFDRFCAAPRTEAGKILHYLNLPEDQPWMDEFCASVRIPESAGRFKQHELGQFHEADLRYLNRLGYPVA